jgi:hypothetical protein
MTVTRPQPAPAARPFPMDCAVTLSLGIKGGEGAERWYALIKWPLQQGHCCAGGHWTPEAAVSHGAELAAARLAQSARALPPGTAGGDLLARPA